MGAADQSNPFSGVNLSSMTAPDTGSTYRAKSAANLYEEPRKRSARYEHSARCLPTAAVASSKALALTADRVDLD